MKIIRSPSEEFTNGRLSTAVNFAENNFSRYPKVFFEPKTNFPRFEKISNLFLSETSDRHMILNNDLSIFKRMAHTVRLKDNWSDGFRTTYGTICPETFPSMGV